MKGVKVAEWENSDALNNVLQGVDTVLLTCTLGTT